MALIQKLLTPEEAAIFLCTSPNTLAVWRSTGRYNLPFVKIGRLVKYREADLVAFIDRRTFSSVA
ncbi:MAG: helix-turn-helix domain-containing protein [Chitinivorax sp.]